MVLPVGIAPPSGPDILWTGVEVEHGRMGGRIQSDSPDLWKALCFEPGLEEWDTLDVAIDGAPQRVLGAPPCPGLKEALGMDDHRVPEAVAPTIQGGEEYLIEPAHLFGAAEFPWREVAWAVAHVHRPSLMAPRTTGDVRAPKVS
jgi:hypothetical protein